MFKLFSKGDQLKINWPTAFFPKLETDPSFYYLVSLVIGGRDYSRPDSIKFIGVGRRLNTYIYRDQRLYMEISRLMMWSR